MDFNPDKYLAEKTASSQGFDPDKYLMQKTGASPEPTRNAPIEAGVNAATNELLMGYLPETKAGLKSIVSDKSYKDLRGEEYQHQKDLEKNNPEAYTTGQAVGIGGSLLIPFGGEAKAASLLGKIGHAAMIGGTQGLLRNPGETSSDKTASAQLGERAKNAAYGAVGGAAITGAARGVESGLKVIGPKVSQEAEDFFVRSLGARPKFFEKESGEKISDVAKFAKDEGIVKAGDSIEAIHDKVTAAKEKYGEELGNLYKTAQDKINGLKSNLNPIPGSPELTPEHLYVPEKLAKASPTIQDLKNEVISSTEKTLKGKGKSGPMNAIESHFDDIAKDYGDQPLSLMDLHDIKSKLGPEIKWNMTDTRNRDVGFKETYKNLGDKINQHMEVMDQALSESGDSKLAESLKDLNKKYSLVSTAEGLTNSASAKSRGLNRVGLTDAIVGAGIGAGAGAASTNGSLEGSGKGLLMGAAGGLLSKNARAYGSPITAQVLSKASSILDKLPIETTSKIMGLIQDKALTDIVKSRLVERFINRGVMNGQ